MTKNQHAVELGRLGGRRGGPARAKALGKTGCVEAAQHAARASWTPSARAKRKANGRRTLPKDSA